MLLIKTLDNLPEELEAKMNNELIKYEAANGIEVNYKKFSLCLFLYEEIIGILSAYTAFAEIYIDDLWIDSNYRDQGYGKKLIHSLEEQFKGQGYNNINLVTSSFQAPEFYKKCGFELEFVRENIKNPKLTKYFFVKFFNEETETQGLIKNK